MSDQTSLNMDNEYYTEFNVGDLMTLRDGIASYPYFQNLKMFKENPKLNMTRFGSDQLIVLDKIYKDNNHLIGYECLCVKEKIYVMDIINKDFKLEVGFCYVNG